MPVGTIEQQLPQLRARCRRAIVHRLLGGVDEPPEDTYRVQADRPGVPFDEPVDGAVDEPELVGDVAELIPPVPS